jgi:hypothetical protein
VAGFLRAGGRGTTAGGRSVIWSVAEGSRGRRYREIRAAGEGMAHSLLLETDPDGRFSHLELSTMSGLLTLHPEGQAALHGHSVVSDGVEHVQGERWDADGIVLVEDSVVCRVAAVHALDRLIEASSSKGHLAVVIPATLWLEIVPVRVERIVADTWRFGAEEPFIVDERGLPSLVGGEIWPLEHD